MSDVQEITESRGFRCARHTAAEQGNEAVSEKEKTDSHLEKQRVVRVTRLMALQAPKQKRRRNRDGVLFLSV